MTQPQTDREWGERERKMAALYGLQVQRGERQLQVVRELMARGTKGQSDLDLAIQAARRTAAFVGRERWVTGPMWAAYGAHWLLARWALDYQFSSKDISYQIKEFFTSSSTGEGEESGAATNTDPTSDSTDASSAEARRRRLSIIRRGSDQVQALSALFHNLLQGSGDVEQGILAATQASRFAMAEKWAGGPLWMAYGMQLLLGRWALEQGISSEQIATTLSSQGGNTA